MLEIILRVLVLFALYIVIIVAVSRLKDVIYWRVNHWIIEAIAMVLIMAASCFSAITIMDMIK